MSVDCGPPHESISDANTVIYANGSDKPTPIMVIVNRRLRPEQAERLRQSLSDYLDSGKQQIAIVEGIDLEIFQFTDGKWTCFYPRPETVEASPRDTDS